MAWWLKAFNLRLSQVPHYTGLSCLASRYVCAGGLRWRQGPPAVLQLLDQRLLPLQTVYMDIDGPKSAWHAIKVCRLQQ